MLRALLVAGLVAIAACAPLAPAELPHVLVLGEQHDAREHPRLHRQAVADLRAPPRIAWLHTNAHLPQHQWYSVPLRYLLEQGCSHFFWAHHDELYLREHVEQGLEDLKESDFSVSARCGLLVTKGDGYRYRPLVDLASQLPGGAGATMCFNRRFARELLADIEADTASFRTVDVVARVTMPKFRCKVSQRLTSVYHSHESSVAAPGWVLRALDAASGTR